MLMSFNQQLQIFVQWDEINKEIVLNNQQVYRKDNTSWWKTSKISFGYLKNRDRVVRNLQVWCENSYFSAENLHFWCLFLHDVHAHSQRWEENIHFNRPTGRFSPLFNLFPSERGGNSRKARRSQEKLKTWDVKSSTCSKAGPSRSLQVSGALAGRWRSGVWSLNSSLSDRGGTGLTHAALQRHTEEKNTAVRRFRQCLWHSEEPRQRKQSEAPRWSIRGLLTTRVDFRERKQSQVEKEEKRHKHWVWC